MRTKHGLTHPIKECCVKARRKYNTIAMVKTKNNVCKKYRRNSRLKSLPIVADCQFTPVESRASIVFPEPDVRKLSDLEYLPMTLCIDSPVSPAPTIPTTKENIAPDGDVGVSSASFMPTEVKLQQVKKALEVLSKQMQEKHRRPSIVFPEPDVRELSDQEYLPITLSIDSPVRPAPMIPTTKENIAPDCDVGVSFASFMAADVQLQQERKELDVLNKQLQEKFRALQLQLKGMKVISDTESNHSDDYIDNPRTQIMQAKMDVVDDHNSRLPKYLNSVQNVMQESQKSDNLDVSPSHFNLHSLSKSQCYPQEEAALQELVERMDKMFPADLSQTASNTSGGMSYMEDEIIRQEVSPSIRAAMIQAVYHFAKNANNKN